MKQIIDRLLYNTETATEICSNKHWDGHNYDRGGRSWSLYKTKKGNFFVHNTTRWQGEFDKITPISIEDALDRYEEATVFNVEYKKAFGIEPEEA